MSLRDFLTRTPSVPAGLPRLTRAATVKAIAQQTGEDTSTIKARLDKRDEAKAAKAAKGVGKRAEANRNPIGTIEFALRYAVDKLGADRVAELVGIGRDSLYKAINPNLPDRKLPDIGWGRIAKVVVALRKAGHTEFFSTALVASGDATAAVAQLPSLHHALTGATLAHGDIARQLALATDPDSPGGEDITPAEAAAIIDAIAASVEAAHRLQEQVLLAAKTKATSS